MNLVEYHVNNRIAFITLNRPEKRNALSPELVAVLKETFRKAEEDGSVKVIVLKANGEAFCAGADLAYLQQLQDFSYEENLADSSNLMELFLQIYTLNKVIIAQVQGHALAGGCGLATVCDFCFTVAEAKFGYTEVKIGFIPAIVMIFLVRKIGEAKARQLLLTGTPITAKEAHALGLVNGIAEQGMLETDVMNLATSLVRTNSAYAMMQTKKMLAAVQDMPLERALQYAAEMNAKARNSEDCKRGVAAFLNKSKLEW